MAPHPSLRGFTNQTPAFPQSPFSNPKISKSPQADRIISIHFNSQEEGHRPTPYERLLNAESKLQSLPTRANKDYRQLQQDRQNQEDQQATQQDDGQEPFCPFVTDETNCGAGVPPADEDDEPLTTDN